jgi:malate dehydrogenase (oxaloacetate-decarboxylating)
MDEELKKISIEYHKKYNGKIGTELRAPLKNKDDLSLAYSPGVGAATLAIQENLHLANDLTLKGRTVLIVSDGSAILGLGNLGALPAIPVMEGKAALLKHFAGVDAFPITLTTQDSEEIIKTVLNISPVFGAVNLEDISAPRCFYIEEELRKRLNIPVMHDDQWGTATVVLAGLINALKLKNLKIEDVKIVISGIGAAGVAVSRLLFTAGAKYIRFVDSRGLITKNRTDLTKEKIELLNQSQSEYLEGGLSDALVGADIFIGLSKPNVLNGEMIQKMATNPIIFALANPVPEIMPDLAKKYGAYIVATGRSDFPNQVNNALVFPGLLKAALEVKGCQFTNEVFLNVAHDLANVITDVDPESIIPSPFNEKVVDVVYTAGKREFLKQLAS